MAHDIYHNDFIELRRTFHELSKTVGDSDDVDLHSVFSTGSGITWDNLLAEYRVVLLSEAGAGKTKEIRNAAQRLRREGKVAFFLRLEHVPNDFEEAFEEGTFEEFEHWLSSGDEGWLLLDSVDEARLKSPSDFERAVKRISRKLASACQRTHIVITGRTTAWRPKTDLALCTNNLSYIPIRAAAEIKENEMGDAENAILVTEKTRDVQKSTFKIMTLDDLTPAQIEIFAEAKGVENTKALREAIERADAYSFTSRPQDLTEVIEFWQDHGRIGTRLELMRNSIARRLIERDQNRAETKPMNAEQTRLGAKLAAGATTLVQKQSIRVPDGAENLDGLPIINILQNWNESDCATVLSRPIFDEAIYGSVRFHHRSVREYLAAEWLNDLLAKESSRRSVEELFFRTQYGLDVVVPSVRPLLPWMIILDERIRDRALRLAPELVFEGGDPSQLPLDTRRKLLREICAEIASHRSNRPSMDFAAVQRFASNELAGDVTDLLQEYATNSDVTWLLLRMIWQGQITAALYAAKAVALNSKASKYPRIAAFRAVAAIGSTTDQTEVRAAFLKERTQLDRDWLCELVNNAKPCKETTAWLLSAIKKVKAKKQFSVDGLAQGVLSFVQHSDLSEVALLVSGMGKLLAHPPVVERLYCEISKRYRWLLKITAIGVERLVEARHESASSKMSFDVLRRLRMVDDANDFDLQNVQLNLPQLVRGWTELHDRLFWFEAAETRKSLNKKNGERLTNWWQVSLGGSLWSWREDDFERTLGFITNRTLLDDKLVALSIAFNLYRQSNRQRKHLSALQRAVNGNPDLEDRLRNYLHPPALSAQDREWKRTEHQWKKRREHREQKEAKSRKDWRTYLLDNVDKLRDPGLEAPDIVSNAQYYLYHQMEIDNSNLTRWHTATWESLIPPYGEGVARAFRDGAVAYWRRNKPKLRSEGAEPNKTLFSTIFGLIGLEFETKETPNWPEGLTDWEAQLATRYAIYELNGFPPWMSTLYVAFPEAVVSGLLSEVRWELDQAEPGSKNLYVMYDICWYGKWMWEKWAPIFLDKLCKWNPLSLDHLEQMLEVIQGSSLPDEQIRDLASGKCQNGTALDHLSHWYAAWVGVDPEHAISSLERRLNDFPDPRERLTFAMQFITHLLGGRRGESASARTAYRTAPHLKSLYLLMNEHIRQRDDIERAGQGVYSPTLRDDAQDARNHLSNLLKEIPGKEAFLALMEISKEHPVSSVRPWFTYQAKSKAEQDAETGPWSIEQFVDFNDHLERTPRNNRELFELAWMRLIDLKCDLENGDSSNASILRTVTLETEMRKYIGNWLREKANGRYSIPQEEELADAKRPDLRFHGAGFDSPIPMELKLADNWTGPHLFERMENQLCGDYLRDIRSSRGIFGLIYRGEKKEWTLPNNNRRVNFASLIQAMQNHWMKITTRFANADEIRVIGIDLTKRNISPKGT